jgi:hypothetical protein
VRFFLDNNLPPRLARALNELSKPEHEVVHLREKFQPDTSDTTWLHTLASEGDWVIVSGDLRITRLPHEQKAWQESGLTAFFLEKGWSSLQFWEKATKLVGWWEAIVLQATRVEAGVGFLVPVRSKKLKILST